VVAFVDIDPRSKGRAYGRKKQSAAFGHVKIGSKSPLIGLVGK
jgi:hypothetical protein